jgi:hypothetical protein
MFHSLAVVLGRGADYASVRALAASAVTSENAPDALMDMAAQMPASLTTPMDVPTNCGQFSPEVLWNESKGSGEAMAIGLKKAIATPGNYLWGDATLASLVEIAANVNVILLAVDAGVKIPPTPKELVFARTIFGRWVENTLANKPDLATSSKETVLAFMIGGGLTWDRALALSRRETGFGPGRWLRGRRQPLGSIKEICANPNAGNLSSKNYLPNRPTVVIWNRSNVHWVPIGVGLSAETLIEPNAPLRAYIDELMK